MYFCKNCGVLLDEEFDIGNICNNCRKRNTVEAQNRIEKRPSEWPKHCECCGRKFIEEETYCYNYCTDCSQ